MSLRSARGDTLYIFLTVNITYKVRNVLKEQAAKTLLKFTFERRLSEEAFQDQRVLSAGNFSDKYRRMKASDEEYGRSNQTPSINKNLPVRVFL